MNQSSGRNWQEVNQEVFEQEKQISLMPGQIRHLGSYILRHLSDPKNNPSFYAIDRLVEIAKAENLDHYKRLSVAVLGRERQVIRTVNMALNYEGFFTFNNGDPKRYALLPEGIVEAGYFIQSVSQDSFDRELSDFIKSQVTPEIEPATPELIIVG